MRRLILLLAFLSVSACGLPPETEREIPFAPTPMEVVDRMLEMAEVGPADLVYDLGSGDGRIVIRAAKRFGARGVGIEIDRRLIARARHLAAQEGVSHLVEFRRQDALTADLGQASVVALYMFPEFNARLRPILEKQLRPGARVVAHDFPIEGWKPLRAETMPGGILHQHTVYLWKIE
ncbi:MAG TPA: methyltransferase domain-containing protein [Candidatus Acidoferrales bacterium]|nr:methyltransferase domain-containing protein [Candidatus Acidoferrales bacterium]